MRHCGSVVQAGLKQWEKKTRDHRGFSYPQGLRLQAASSFFPLIGLFAQCLDFRGKEPELLGRVSKDYVNVHHFTCIVCGIM